MNIDKIRAHLQALDEMKEDIQEAEGEINNAVTFFALLDNIDSIERFFTDRLKEKERKGMKYEILRFGRGGNLK